MASREYWANDGAKYKASRDEARGTSERKTDGKLRGWKDPKTRRARPEDEEGKETDGAQRALSGPRT